MEKEDIKKSLFEYIKVIIITVVFTLAVLYFIQISRVVGASMEPTYHNGNIVVAYHVSPGEDQIIKRIIGLPGDHIEMKDNKLYRNGELLNEDYIKEAMVGNEDFAYDIPEGKVFVMGDNRNNSIDSRMIGYIDFDDQVVGRVFFKVF